MKPFILSLFFVVGILRAAEPEGPGKIEFVTAKPATGRSLPSYVLYRHFLGWVNSLGGGDTKADAGNAAALRNALPSHVELAENDLRFLRAEALSLCSELDKRDKKAALIISDYRKRATIAVQKGQTLPPVPLELAKLQQEKTALLVQRYIDMQSRLEANGKAQLEGYLRNEFAPHISITDLVGQQPRKDRMTKQENSRLGAGRFE